MDASITIGQLSEISLAVRAAIRTGVSNQKPSYGIVAAVEHIARTPVYATGSIEKTVITYILDTGAGICLISEALVKKLGWSIDEASNSVLVVADGKESPVLGVVKNVPVTFGSCTIPIDMIVTESTSYDVILGTNWLHLAKAEVNVKHAWMKFVYHGQKHKIPVDTNRSTRSNIINSDDESSDENEGNFADLQRLKPVYTILDFDEDPMERRAKKWRCFAQNEANKKTRRRYPTYNRATYNNLRQNSFDWSSKHATKTQVHREESDDDYPLWQKEARDNYSSGEEETFFAIPKHKERAPR